MAAAGAKDLPAIGIALKEPGVPPRFITHMVEKQLRQRYVFCCDGRPMMPWRSCDPADTKELSERLQNAAIVTIKRLRVEFPSDDVRAHLSCFDCKGNLQHMKKPRGDPLRQEVFLHVKALVLLLKLPPERAILEYRDAAQPVLALVAEGQPLAAASNPAVWSRVLEPTFVCTGRVAPLVFLPVMIRFSEPWQGQRLRPQIQK